VSEPGYTSALRLCAMTPGLTCHRVLAAACSSGAGREPGGVYLATACQVLVPLGRLRGRSRR